CGRFRSGGSGRALEVLADLVGELVDLLLGLVERGLGPCGPLGGAGLAQARLPGCPVTALGPPEPGHDRTTPSGPACTRSGRCDATHVCPGAGDSCVPWVRLVDGA